MNAPSAPIRWICSVISPVFFSLCCKWMDEWPSRCIQIALTLLRDEFMRMVPFTRWSAALSTLDGFGSWLIIFLLNRDRSRSFVCSLTIFHFMKMVSRPNSCCVLNIPFITKLDKTLYHWFYGTDWRFKPNTLGNELNFSSLLAKIAKIGKRRKEEKETWIHPRCYRIKVLFTSHICRILAIPLFLFVHLRLHYSFHSLPNP